MELYSKEIPGTGAVVWLRTDSSDGDLYRVLIEELEYAYVEFETAPKIIIDAGANIGLSSVYFATQYPSARIFAIEPEKDNFELLRKNTERFQNITPICAALMQKEGQGVIFDTGDGSLAYQVKEVHDQLGEVSCITIPSLCAEHSISKIDLLKIDIEGAEKEIFSDNCDWLSIVDVLIIELHERIVSECNKTVFDAVQAHFDYEWIGGENYFFAKSDIALPKIPIHFKSKTPQELPIEKVWKMQQMMDQQHSAFANTLLPIYERIQQLEQLYSRVDSIEKIYPSMEQLESQSAEDRKRAVTTETWLANTHTRVDALESGLQETVHRIDAVEPWLANTHERAEQLEPQVAQLQQRIDAVEPWLANTHERAEQLEPQVAQLQQRIDAVEPCLFNTHEQTEQMTSCIAELQRSLEAAEIQAKCLQMQLSQAVEKINVLEKQTIWSIIKNTVRQMFHKQNS